MTLINMNIVRQTYETKNIHSGLSLSANKVVSQKKTEREMMTAMYIIIIIYIAFYDYFEPLKKKKNEMKKQSC